MNIFDPYQLEHAKKQNEFMKKKKFTYAKKGIHGTVSKKKWVDYSLAKDPLNVINEINRFYFFGYPDEKKNKRGFAW